MECLSKSDMGSRLNMLSPPRIVSQRVPAVLRPKGHVTLRSRKPSKDHVKGRGLCLRCLGYQIQQQLSKQAHPQESVSPCKNPHCAKSNSDWCGFPVYMEQRDWEKVLNTGPDAVEAVRSRPGDLYREYVLPEGLKVMHVSGKDAVAQGVDTLVKSMQDPIVAFDMKLESNRPVGLLQVASSSSCVLINARDYWSSKVLPSNLAELLT